jgi:hypothetical protein
MSVTSSQIWKSLFLAIFSLVYISPSFALEDIPGKETSIFSPIIQVAEHQGKGFIRVSAGGGVMWIEASPEAKPHLPTLPVGSLFDVKIMFRGKPNPPVIKSWKVLGGETPCPIFDGKSCVKQEAAK